MLCGSMARENDTTYHKITKGYIGMRHMTRIFEDDGGSRSAAPAVPSKGSSSHSKGVLKVNHSTSKRSAVEKRIEKTEVRNTANAVATQKANEQAAQAAQQSARVRDRADKNERRIEKTDLRNTSNVVAAQRAEAQAAQAAAQQVARASDRMDRNDQRITRIEDRNSANAVALQQASDQRSAEAFAAQRQQERATTFQQSYQTTPSSEEYDMVESRRFAAQAAATPRALTPKEIEDEKMARAQIAAARERQQLDEALQSHDAIGMAAAGEYGTPVVPPASSHVVAAGDNLTKIAQKYGVSLQELRTLNPDITNINLIRTGQQIKIPGGEAPQVNLDAVYNSSEDHALANKAMAAQVDLANAAEDRRRAGQGESRMPGFVSSFLGLFRPKQVEFTEDYSNDVDTTNAVKYANDALAPVSIQLPPSYTVAVGDTLSRLAKQYGVDLKAIRALNPQIKNLNKVKAGEQIKLPGGTIVTVQHSELGDAVASQGSPYPSATKISVEHTVIAGDNLTEIAKRYGTDLNKIRELNPHIKNPNRIHPGEKVKLPGGEAMAGQYAGIDSSGAATPVGVTTFTVDKP